MNWTTFHTDQTTTLRITCKQHEITQYSIRPSRLKIESQTLDNNRLQLEILPGQKVSVEFSENVKEYAFTGPPFGIPVVMDPLMIFAAPQPRHSIPGKNPENIVKIPPGIHAHEQTVGLSPGTLANKSALNIPESKEVVVFTPGIHKLGYWQVANHIKHTHIEAGAIVYGAFDILPAGREPDQMDITESYRDKWHQEPLRETFKISGSGVLSGSKLPWHLKKDFTYHQHDHYWAHIKLLQLPVRKISLSDVTLCDAPYWTLTFMNDADTRTTGTFDNFKIVGSWTYNNDGLLLPRNGVIRNAFIHADDDAFKISHSNAQIENCVVWQNSNGAVFQFGWFPKTLSQIQLLKLTNLGSVKEQRH